MKFVLDTVLPLDHPKGQGCTRRIAPSKLTQIDKDSTNKKATLGRFVLNRFRSFIKESIQRL
ncbi:hypothetical protein F0259_09095 [Vibrio cyclitrophicus]|nr:hypothetical protein [Vibrio cyclitrophicus]